MKKLMIHTMLYTLLICPGAAYAEAPDCGFSASNDVYPDGKKDSTRNLKLAVAVTEKMGQGDVPLSFFSWYQLSKSTNGKVTHQVSIYRGQKRIWTKKRTVDLERMDFTSDSWNTFCDAYSKGLKPGDIVVFEFGLRGHSIPADGAELRGQLGPRGLWNRLSFLDTWGHGLFECP